MSDQPRGDDPDLAVRLEYWEGEYQYPPGLLKAGAAEIRRLRAAPALPTLLEKWRKEGAEVLRIDPTGVAAMMARGKLKAADELEAALRASGVGIGSSEEQEMSEPDLPEPDVQLLAWAVGNCHMLARRALARSTSVYDREKWEHVLRICEKAGARSQGVRRASLPTELTEGAEAGIGSPRPPEPQAILDELIRIVKWTPPSLSMDQWDQWTASRQRDVLRLAYSGQPFAPPLGWEPQVGPQGVLTEWRGGREQPVSLDARDQVGAAAPAAGTAEGKP